MLDRDAARCEEERNGPSSTRSFERTSTLRHKSPNISPVPYQVARSGSRPDSRRRWRSRAGIGYVSAAGSCLVWVLFLLSPNSASGNTAQEATSKLVTTPVEAIAMVNEQRSVNGIPPIQLDQSLLKPECSLVNHEIASPSVFSWGREVSPWGRSPLHEAILYSPLATAASYAVYPGFVGPEGRGNEEYACMWFRHDWENAVTADPPRFYVFTSVSGPGAVPSSELAGEWPFTPQEAVGLPPETASGPSLLVYALGLGQEPKIVTASITAESGQPVETRWASGELSSQSVRSGFISGAGDVFAVHPLNPARSYSATVEWEGSEGARATQSFSFKTEPADPPPLTGPPVAETHHLATRRPALRIIRASRRGSKLRLRLQVASVLVGRELIVSLRPAHTRPTRPKIRIVTIPRSLTISVPVHIRGPVEVGLAARGFKERGIRYLASSARVLVRR